MIHDPDSGDDDLNYDVVGITFDGRDVLAVIAILSVIIAVVITVATH